MKGITAFWMVYRKRSTTMDTVAVRAPVITGEAMTTAAAMMAITRTVNPARAPGLRLEKFSHML